MVVNDRVTGPMGRWMPAFSLPSSSGSTVSLWDYKARRNLVIFFTPSLDEDGCADTLRAFADHYEDYRASTTEVVAIDFSTIDRAANRARALTLPFPVLADENGDVRSRYAALASADATDAIVLIADRFGQMWAYSKGKTCREIFSQDEILKWLDFIEFQCPE